MSLTYFIPDADPTTQRNAVTAELVRELGLSHVADRNGSLGGSRTSNGPGGISGLMCDRNGSPLRYDIEKQRWQRSPGAGLAPWWVGCPIVGVEPAALLRPDAVGGDEVELGDGRRWLVPRIYGVMELLSAAPDVPRRQTSLPLAFGLDDDTGEPTLGVAARYDRLREAAFDVWLESVTSGDDDDDSQDAAPDRSFAARLRLCVDALALNYRVTMVEAVGLLGLFDTPSLNRVLRQLIDAEEVERVARQRAREATDPKPEAASATPAAA